MSSGLLSFLQPFFSIINNSTQQLAIFLKTQTVSWIDYLAQVSQTLIFILLVCSLLLYLSQFSINRILAWPYKAFLYLLRRLNLLKGHRRWGVVYDSISKEPIDPVLISVRDRLGKEVASAITDLDGRFGLILPPGSFRLVAQKTNYLFPSKKLWGKKTDGYFSGLYFGQWFNITSNERSIAFAIPLDPQKEDWNQEEKKRRRITSIDRRDFKVAGTIYFLIVGILLAVKYAVYTDPVVGQYLRGYFLIFVLIFTYSLLMPTHYYHSVVIDTQKHKPLAFARIKVFKFETKRQVATKKTSLSGQFVCLLPNGRYYLTIEKRDENGQYQLVKISEPFNVVDRAINKQFLV